jgi:hypothetical protein
MTSQTRPRPVTVKFRGGTYKIAEHPGIWGMMQFARSAKSGLSLLDMESLAALHAFLEGCLDPADWARFQDDMIATKVARVDDLLDFAISVVGKMTDALGAEQAKPAANGASGSVPPA